MMAANMTAQPVISLRERVWCRIIHPARTEMQDSRLMIRDAIVGFRSLCR